MEHLPDESTVYHTGVAASPDRPPAGAAPQPTPPDRQPPPASEGPTTESAAPAAEPGHPAAPARPATMPGRPADPGRPPAPHGASPEDAARRDGVPRAGTGRRSGTARLTPVFTAAPPPLHRPVEEALRPRAFALADEAGVRAYGLLLPDGTALTVQWSAEGSGALGMWSAPQAPAQLWVCELVWLDGPERAG